MCILVQRFPLFNCNLALPRKAFHTFIENVLSHATITTVKLPPCSPAQGFQHFHGQRALSCNDFRCLLATLLSHGLVATALARIRSCAPDWNSKFHLGFVCNRCALDWISKFHIGFVCNRCAPDRNSKFYLGFV